MGLKGLEETGGKEKSKEWGVKGVKARKLMKELLDD